MAGTIVQVRDSDGGVRELLQYEDLLMPVQFQKVDPPVKLKSIRECEYRDGDVLVCSFPKSGTHWTCNLVHFLLSTGPIETTPSITPHLLDLFSMKRIVSLPRPRVLVSHLKLGRLPREHIYKQGKMILLVRNPKDIAVSYYLHSKKDKVQSSGTQSWDGFINGFLSGKVAYGSVFDYWDSWQEVIKLRNDLSILVVYYEKLKTDCLAELRRIQAYLGVCNHDDRLHQIIRRCSLQNLKHDVDTGKTKTPLVDHSGTSILYRKGEIGDWRNHLTVAQNEAFDKVIRERLTDSMFKFQYEPSVPKHRL